MYIHTVAPGQSLSSIGLEYAVDPGLIARINGLKPPYPLAVGQSLLILRPQLLHMVRPGETLSSIARDNGTTVLQLLRNNPNLGGVTQLYAGEVLVIDYEDAPRRAVEVSGYAYPFVEEPVLRGILPYATYLAPFTYGISALLGLVQLDDEALVRWATEYGVVPLMHLSTLTEAGNFSSDRAAQLLSNPVAQEILASAITARMVEKGYGGLDVDFEFVGRENAAAYAAFVGVLQRQVNALGYELIVALAPKTYATQPGALYEGHDYAALAQNADGVLLMTYEWGYTYGPPLAVAPYESVRRVLDYAVTEIPPEKIFLGFPNYAYDWTLPFVAGESRARSISNPEAVDLAIAYGAAIQFDETSRTPYFNYTDATGSLHEVWFEDVRSSNAKFDLVVEYGFRGLGYWNFMRPFVGNFSLLNAKFDIVNKGWTGNRVT